jgi:hypothetical protein
MSRESRTPILFRVVALQQDYFVALEPREIKPAVLRIVCETIDLADFVTVHQVGRNKVLRVD